jgi:hypothetical protein
MFKSAKTSPLNSSVSAASSTRSRALLSNGLEQTAAQPTSFKSRSRLEIGTFDRVFTTSGSVRRSFDDVFRFNLNSRRRLRIYLGNEFSNPNSNNRRMTISLLDDRTLRRVTNTTVNPTNIGAITRTLDRGTYRLSISTQSNNRGRYFMDMVRI